MSVIDIDGRIDTSLSRGLRKRMTREANEDADRVLARWDAQPIEQEARWSGKRWMIEYTRWIEQMAGVHRIATVNLDKRRRMILSINPEPIGRLYFVNASLLDRKHRTVDDAVAPLVLTTHFVERYFQRVGRPFSFRELALVMRNAACVVAREQGLRPEMSLHTPDGTAYFSRGLVKPDGLPVEESTAPEEPLMVMIAKTFIGAADMSQDKRERWQAAVTRGGQTCIDLAPEGLIR